MEHQIPHLTLQQLTDYRDHHTPPGGFVRACLENDFVAAAGRADLSNARALQPIARFIFCRLPHGSWGSPAKVDRWVENRNAATSMDESAANG